MNEVECVIPTRRRRISGPRQIRYREDYADDAALGYWLDLCLAFNPLAKASKKRPGKKQSLYLSRMKPYQLLPAFVLLLFCAMLPAQTTSDNFEDGDLLNPEWFGDNANFVVSGGRLRLMAGGAGESVLSLRLPPSRTTVADSFRLEFLAEMSFAPSASNFCTIDLLRENTIGDIDETGIYLRLGGISGDQDALSGRIIQSGDVLLGDFTGTAGALGQDPAIVRLLITFHLGTGYKFYADYTGGRDFVLQGEVATEIDLPLDYFRLTCIYTATRTDKFSFDDLNYQVYLPADNTAPELVAGSVIFADEAELLFSESPITSLAGDPANYVTSLAGNSITDATVSGTTVRLQFAQPFPLRQDFTVTVLRTEDEAGNVVANLVQTLRYDPTLPPNATNVIINEFMADPTPTVNLPDAEYVELYNPTDVSVDLSGLGIASGGTPVILGADARLPAGGYLVLVNASAAQAFRDLGAEVYAISLPSLTNSGDEISLEFAGETLSRLNYTDDWYNDPDRNAGGFSLEFTGGADAGCSASWRASLDPSGGTPGRANSIVGMPVDDQAPMISEVEISTSGITLTFDEAIDPAQLTPALFQTDNGLTIAAVTDLGDNRVFLSADVVEGIIYTLTILPDYSDCGGNFPAEAIELQLAIPSEPAAGDVIINEILFNPASGGADFVELFNCSDKVFQIRDWTLTNTQSTSSTAQRTVTTSRLFLPGDYLTFTSDPEAILNTFLEVNPALLIEQTLPSLPDDVGNITVASASGVVLDAFDYDEDFHSSLLSPNDGVSLERLRKQAATQDGANWYSAASAEHFGTPTRANSQNRNDLPAQGEDFFSLVTTTFSPDGDGYEDFLELQYQTDRSGFLARVRIFDAQGRLIRTLRQTELLGASGTLRWDGADEDGQKARAGLYVLYAELVNPDGETKEEKLVGVLAGER